MGSVIFISRHKMLLLTISTNYADVGMCLHYFLSFLRQSFTSSEVFESISGLISSTSGAIEHQFVFYVIGAANDQTDR